MIMKIIGMKTENFMGLKFLDMSPDQVWQPIMGANAQGKSSAIKAIRWGLGGGDYAPEKLIHNGADSAEVRIDLGDFVVKRRKTAEGSMTLKIEPKDGSKKTYSKPQQFLNDLGLNTVAFDPVSFANLRDSEQAEILRKVSGLDTRDLDAEAEDVYAQRTDSNRRAKAAKARLDALEPVEIPDEPGNDIDLAAIIEESNNAQVIIRKNEKIRAEARRLDESLRSLLTERDRLLAELVKCNESIAATEERLAKAKPVLETLTDPNVSEIAEKLQKAQEENRMLARRRESRRNAIALSNQRDVVEQEVIDAERESAHHTSRLDEIAREKQALIEKCKLPLTGLSITGDRVTYHGTPIRDCSKSERIRIGLAIASALNPSLDVLLVESGESLDHHQMEELRAWALSRDVQVIIEIVGDSPEEIAKHPGAVVVEAGRKKTAKKS